MNKAYTSPKFKLNNFLIHKKSKTIVEVVGMDAGFYTLRKCSDGAVCRFWSNAVDFNYEKVDNLKLARQLYGD